MRAEHKCKVVKFGDYWFTRCPICPFVAFRGAYESAIEEALDHYRLRELTRYL